MTSDEPKTDRTVARYPLWQRWGPHGRWQRIGRFATHSEALAAAKALAATDPTATFYIGEERADALRPERTA
jgi:hypothetical protein